MATESSPSCLRHRDEVPMLLSSLHSDRSSPSDLLALYECPECGAERRLPVELASVPVGATLASPVPADHLTVDFPTPPLPPPTAITWRAGAPSMVARRPRMGPTPPRIRSMPYKVDLHAVQAPLKERYRADPSS